jgi:hypothetical protein
MPQPSRLRSVRRALRRHRRPLAALATAGALWAGLHAVARPPSVAVPVAVAAVDLPAGAALSAADVRVVGLPPTAVPDGATTPPDGTVLTGPLRRGEPFTDVRLAGNALARPAGTVLVTVRVADPAAVLAVRPGDRVDVLAGPSAAPVTDAAGAEAGDSGRRGVEEATTIGTDLLVLAVPGRPDGDPTRLVTGGVGGAEPGAPDDGTGILGAVGPSGPGAGFGGGEVDAAGVVVLAADRRAAARVAASSGIRLLTVVVVSR